MREFRVVREEVLMREPTVYITLHAMSSRGNNRQSMAFSSAGCDRSGCVFSSKSNGSVTISGSVHWNAAFDFLHPREYYVFAVHCRPSAPIATLVRCPATITRDHSKLLARQMRLSPPRTLSAGLSFARRPRRSCQDRHYDEDGRWECQEPTPHNNGLSPRR